MKTTRFDRIRTWIRYDRPHHGKPSQWDGAMPKTIRRWFGSASMQDNACTLELVTGAPYHVDDGRERWLVYCRRSACAMEDLVAQVAQMVAPRPCAAELRVYGEVPSATHVLSLPSAEAAVPLLARCEAVGVFNGEVISRDQHSIIQQLRDPSAPRDDEASLLRAIRPRPVLFLHAGHEDVDVVFYGRSHAERLLAFLRQRARHTR